MYEVHFGLRRRPFRPVPDIDSYYPASGHESALAEVRTALDEGEGFAVVTAGAGMGKTLFGHRLLMDADPGSRTVFVTNTHFAGRADMLRAVLFDLRLPHHGFTEQELRLALSETCMEHLRQGSHTDIVMDEAHHLTPDLLEELRMWGNLESPQGKGVRIILLGLPPLASTLRSKELTALAQRTGANVTLEPLSKDESVEYLNHQLAVAGGQPEALITGEAAELIAERAGGVPRLLNQLASASFRLAAQAEMRQVDAEVVLELAPPLDQSDEQASATESGPATVLPLPRREDEINSSKPKSSRGRGRRRKTANGE